MAAPSLPSIPDIENTTNLFLTFAADFIDVNNNANPSIGNILLNVVIFTISIIKVMMLVRVFPELVVLVEIIYAVFYDISAFLVIFCSHILVFAIMSIITGTAVDDP